MVIGLNIFVSLIMEEDHFQTCLFPVLLQPAFLSLILSISSLFTEQLSDIYKM